jgi:signal transduction histidine kinase
MAGGGRSAPITLVHRLLHSEKSTEWLLVHYPLVIDSYWFIGFAYFLERGVRTPGVEAFDREKYHKCRSILTDLVAEPLRAALYQEALARLDEQDLLNGRTPFDEVFRRLLQNLFPCFDILKEGERHPAVRRPLSVCDGAAVYGPAWILASSSRKIRRLLQREINRRREDLAAEIDRRKQRDASAREAEARMQIERWAHNMQTRLLPASIWARDLVHAGPEAAEGSRKLPALASQIEVLLRTAQTLSRFGRVESRLRQEKKSICDLAGGVSRSSANLAVSTVALGDMLFEALLLMVVRIDAKDPVFEPVVSCMPCFKQSCALWLPRALALRAEQAKKPAVLDASFLSELADGKEFTLRTILPRGYKALNKFRVWTELKIPGIGGFRCDTAIGMVFDNILSNACRYVQKPNDAGSAMIELKLEVHGHAGLQVKETLMADLDLVNTANMASHSGSSDLLASYDQKGHGLASCRDTATLFTGSQEDFTARITSDQRHVHTHFRFPVVYD